MQELACKIKKILAVNDLGLDEQFIDFFKTEQQLQQLSRLISELKKQSSIQPVLNTISEPHQVENKTEIASQDVMIDKALDLNIENAVVVVEPEPTKNNLDVEDKEQDHLEQNTALVFDAQLDQKIDLELTQEHLIAEAEQNGQDQLKLSEILIDPEQARTVPEQQAQIEKNRAEITDVFKSKMINELKFQVDNARAGQEYCSKIQVISALVPENIEFITESFKFPNEQFQFDEQSQSIQGQPTEADEFNFSFQYRVNHEIYTGQCRINVIPDPRSLWKVIEPKEGQAFIKPHTDQFCIDTENYQLIAASRRGRSHEHAGSFRDDDFCIAHIAKSSWSILAVADGAGSAEYSREGSRVAVEIVQKEFQRYFNEYTIDALDADIKLWQVDQPQEAETQRIANKLNQQFYNVYYEIYRSILTQLDQLAQEMNVAAKAFSTTLLVAVIYQHPEKNLISTFSVGDGAIAVLSDDMVRMMNVADGGEYAGQTKFLDRSIHHELGSRIKIGCFKDLNAVLLMTDGISDPVFETDAGLANQQKWLDLYAELQPIFAQTQPEQALLEWMHFFKTGHHDDRTLAALWKKSSEK